jgi:ribose-phosphate pyrophosphokinase
MKKVVIACSGARHISKEFAKKLNAEYSELQMERFPDGELDIKFLKELKGKRVILIQSFYGDVQEKIVETLFAGHTAKDLKAKKVELLALYFPYLRKDKRFTKGECVSIEVMDKLFRIFNKVYVIDPHLHRIKEIKKILKKGVRLSAVPVIAEHIKKLNLKNMFFIGPDIESKQWAAETAKLLDSESSIFQKTRYGPRKVKVKIAGKVDIENKNVVIIDDIISSGHTMLQAVRELKKLKPKKIYCIGIHGLFMEDSLKKLKKEAIVLSTNTVPSKVSKINIADVIRQVK